MSKRPKNNMTLEEIEVYLNDITRQAILALNRNLNINLKASHSRIVDYKNHGEFYLLINFPKKSEGQEFTLRFENDKNEGLISLPDSFKPHGDGNKYKHLSLEKQNILRFAFGMLEYGKKYKII